MVFSPVLPSQLIDNVLNFNAFISAFKLMKPRIKLLAYPKDYLKMSPNT